ncbi:MAG: hypothetical protein KAS32_27415, partial [Candidatus Peribacteraceae bacterium]|nr:hypothetical protein [Candidatus Peribacteraceae bacterium]
MRRVNSQELHRYSIDDFSGGINTDSAKTLPNEISIGTNFNLTQRGLLEVRGGSETKNSSNLIPVTSGIGPTSLFELWTRDLATGVKTRHQFGTAKTNLFSIQTTGDTLVVTGLTNLDTGLTNDLVPSVAKMQNKAFLVNGKESRWTDGITSEEVGVEMPTVDPVHNTSYATGGGMSDGTYRFYYAYGRSTNYGFYGEVGDYVEVTLSGGGAAQKVSIDCKATNSTSTSADKIYLFRTKPGDNASWYQVNTASNPDDNSTVTVECLLGDNEILDTTLYDEDHTPPISGVKYIQAGGNRMYYADDNYVYYSKPNLPECVPALNIIKFSEDDGENITSIGIILNYILVTKQTSTYIIDMSVVGEHDPILISNNIGCVSHRTMEPLMNGQITMWLSQEGFVATDGVQVTSVVKDK